jgi:hypothetical protein
LEKAGNNAHGAMVKVEKGALHAVVQVAILLMKHPNALVVMEEDIKTVTNV